MRFASGIKCRMAMNTAHIAGKVLMDRQFFSAYAAQDSSCIPFVRLPTLYFVIRILLMAIIACIVTLAAFE
jgi:hypothetical protein